MVGGASADRSKHAWRQVYRSLNHGPAKNACNSGKLREFPSEVFDFGMNFKTLQEKRHTADYDPVYRFTLSEVDNLIQTAEDSIRGFMSAPKKDRRAFAALVLFQGNRH